MTKLEQLKEIIETKNPNLEDILIAIEKGKPKIKITDNNNVDYGKMVDITDEEKTRIMLAWKLGQLLSKQKSKILTLILEILINY